MRIALALSLFVLPPHYRLGVLLTALATEFLDGFLARRFHWQSKLGTFLDPIADKFFVIAYVLILFQENALTFFECFFLWFRELTVIIACFVYLLKGRGKIIGNMQPRVMGKLTTAMQFIFLILITVWPLAEGKASDAAQQVTVHLLDTAFYLTVTCGVIASIDYVVSFMQHMASKDLPQSKP
jgi:CDP-diacylglycerol--glycerol-3-phosphate 3-phosphatidyltransferase